ncbi:MAG TPA: S8 family serine peptidase [Candidatus Limnocylindrales bacterium]|jgi:subtilisin family serine protease
MKRFVSALAVVVLLLGVVPAALAAGPTRHFSRPDVDLSKVDPSFRPMLATPNRKVTVVVELAPAPAVAQGLTVPQQQARARMLRTSQGKLDGRIKSLGGRVLDRYQYAYNGIKVQTTTGRLPKLAAMPGVVAIHPIKVLKPMNVNAVPYVGAPTAWQTNGATGAGETIAVIDSGIDYTHADFGGAGTTAAYNANDPAVIEPGSFPTAKVVAGWDFVGNHYDDPSTDVPVPDPDPLDCGIGHGSHVSGTAAGEGVLADHSTYSGPYDPSIYTDPNKFVIGPGVAPLAKLIALKVFGCGQEPSTSTDIVISALEWVAAYNVRHADGIDVVNLSLGGDFGQADDPDAVAINNIVSMGVVVVAADGNANHVPFITGGPATATKAISVAALDAFPSIPMATVDLPGGVQIPGNNQSASTALPISGTLHVESDGAGGVSLGCTAADYDAGTAGKIVAIKRGVCAFVDKGAAAQAAGAIGIIMINRDDTAPGDLPTFIGSDPQYFTIPMIGVDKTAQPILLANEGAAVTLSPNGSAPNPTYQQIADFSSAGPRYGDNWLKPDVAAPGVNVFSDLVGTGWDGAMYSGTSMATPMTSGMAALVLSVHPNWSPLKVKAAIVNTADASTAKIIDYDPLLSGSGVAQVDRAVATTGLVTTSQGTASLSFGYAPSDGAYRETKTIRIWNTSSHKVRYNLSASSSLVSFSPSSVNVGAHDSREVKVTASLSRSAVASLPSADQFLTGAFGELTSMSGAITVTPTATGAGQYPLRVAYLLVPRGLSDVETTYVRQANKPGPNLMAKLKVSNHGVHDGAADTYALGRLDPRGDGDNGTDIRAIGVQSVPASVLTGADDPSDRGIQFAINSYDRFSTAAPSEVDVAVDTDGDGEPNYFVIGIDDGALFAGVIDGQFLSVVIDASTNDIVDAWLADAPFNGSTLLLPALASDLGLTAEHGSFSYWVAAFDFETGLADETAATRPFDVFNPAQSTGDFVQIPSHGHATIPAWASKAAIRSGDVRGWLVVSLDDRNGGAQAQVIRP